MSARITYTGSISESFRGLVFVEGIPQTIHDEAVIRSLETNNQYKVERLGPPSEASAQEGQTSESDSAEQGLDPRWEQARVQLHEAFASLSGELGRLNQQLAEHTDLGEQVQQLSEHVAKVEARLNGRIGALRADVDKTKASVEALEAKVESLGEADDEDDDQASPSSEADGDEADKSQTSGSPSKSSKSKRKKK